MRANGAFVRNASSNLLVGGAGLAYAVAVPAIVVRRFGVDAYGTWFGAFQLAAYILVLDLGTQILIANSAATEDHDGQARLVSAALLLQLGAAAAVSAAMAAGGAILRGMPFAGYVALLCAGASLSLLAATVRSWYIGRQRAGLASLWTVFSRISAVGAASGAAVLKAPLLTLTAYLTLVPAAMLVLFLVVSVTHERLLVIPSVTDLRHVAARTSHLALWAILGLSVSGFDIYIVYWFDRAHAGEYAIALAAISVPTGIATAVAGAWSPILARARTRASLTTDAISKAAGLLAIGSILFIGLPRIVFTLWLGAAPPLATTATELLYVGQAIRLVLLPWVTHAVLEEAHAPLTTPAVAEAVVNLGASMLLGSFFGAIGVAGGTVAGSLVSFNLVYQRIDRLAATTGVTARAIRAGFQRAGTVVVTSALCVVVLLLLQR